MYGIAATGRPEQAHEHLFYTMVPDAMLRTVPVPGTGRPGSLVVVVTLEYYY